ncbi:hypothetical protein BH11PLA2_BH11PLA2_38380 [soil metagenome]
MKRKPWHPHEIRHVIERYNETGPDAIAHELGRSDDSVSSLARRYGLKTARKPYRRAKKETASVKNQ